MLNNNAFCGPVVTAGVNEKGVISKVRTGGFPVSSFPTLVKTQKKRYLEHDDLISHTTLLQYEKTLAYNITLQILSSSVLARRNYWPLLLTVSQYAERFISSKSIHIILSLMSEN